MKTNKCRYNAPVVEWENSFDENWILCQSPQGGLTDIGVEEEEADDEHGWF